MHVLHPHTILILIKQLQPNVVIIYKQTHRIGRFFIIISLWVEMGLYCQVFIKLVKPLPIKLFSCSLHMLFCLFLKKIRLDYILFLVKLEYNSTKQKFKNYK